MAMAFSDDFGNYTHAVVCGIPNSFVQAIGSNERIDLQQVRKEHTQYVQHLKSMGLQVVEMWPNENFPDCPFVEDTAVICNGQALITRPGHPVRRDEVRIDENNFTPNKIHVKLDFSSNFTIRLVTFEKF